MTMWIILAALLLMAGLLLWQRLFRRPETPSMASQIPPFKAVSIRPGMNACKAAWLLVGERYLKDEAPPLPLEGCDMTQCDCSYNTHEDRREPGERRQPELDGPEGENTGSPYRIRHHGRRKEDLQSGE